MVSHVAQFGRAPDSEFNELQLYMVRSKGCQEFDSPRGYMKTIIEFLLRGIATIIVSIGTVYGSMYIVKLIIELL